MIAIAACGAAALVGAGCGAHPAPPSSTAAVPTTGSTLPVSTTTTLVPPGPEAGWSVVSQTVSGLVNVDRRTVVEADGTQVTVVRFRAGRVQAALHAGSQEPPRHGVIVPAAAGSTVSPTEQPFLLGAFNGGFKAADAPGGFVVGGAVVSAPVTGQASLVLYADGGVSVGAWNSPGIPQADRPVTSVRQNLVPLVTAGQPSATVGDTKAWGDPLHEIPLTARSGVAVDRAGDLLYAASIKALPVDLAGALVTGGATDAMELDINPAWVQLDLASVPGGPLTAALPGQSRPAGQYLTGWTRDFITVVATPEAAAGRTLVPTHGR